VSTQTKRKGAIPRIWTGYGRGWRQGCWTTGGRVETIYQGDGEDDCMMGDGWDEFEVELCLLKFPFRAWPSTTGAGATARIPACTSKYFLLCDFT
jgi:hypothetical protein